MSITVYNKQTIINEIERLENCLILERVIREKVEAFKHRKLVNKTFTDSFEDTGYSAWITKDRGNTSLRIRKNIWTGSRHLEVDFYVTVYSSMFSQELLTWDKILAELDRYSFSERLKNEREKLECLDEEIIELQKLVNHIESIQFKCVNLYGIKNDLKHALFQLERNQRHT